jgi:hypothetical protein
MGFPRAGPSTGPAPDLLPGRTILPGEKWHWSGSAAVVCQRNDPQVGAGAQRAAARASGRLRPASTPHEVSDRHSAEQVEECHGRRPPRLRAANLARGPSRKVDQRGDLTYALDGAGNDDQTAGARREVAPLPPGHDRTLRRTATSALDGNLVTGSISHGTSATPRLVGGDDSQTAIEAFDTPRSATRRQLSTLQPAPTHDRLSLTAAPMSRASVGSGGWILRAPGGPVDLDRYALRVGSRVDQV